MAGNEHRVVAHGPQALRDAVYQMLVIALREVGAANAAGKQYIADKRAVHLGRIKHHVARRVARARRTESVCLPSVTVSPSASQRVGLKARAGGKP